MEDYRTAALQVQAHIRHEEKNAERLEMCINADIITKTSCVRSLLARFGEEYRDYMRKVNRVIPLKKMV